VERGLNGLTSGDGIHEEVGDNIDHGGEGGEVEGRVLQQPVGGGQAGRQRQEGGGVVLQGQHAPHCSRPGRQEFYTIFSVQSF
jgi:hypothetical protein